MLESTFLKLSEQPTSNFRNAFLFPSYRFGKSEALRPACNAEQENILQGPEAKSKFIGKQLAGWPRVSP